MMSEMIGQMMYIQIILGMKRIMYKMSWLIQMISEMIGQMM